MPTSSFCVSTPWRRLSPVSTSLWTGCRGGSRRRRRHRGASGPPQRRRRPRGFGQLTQGATAAGGTATSGRVVGGRVFTEGGGEKSKSTLIPTSYTSPARPPYIHKKNKKQFSQKYVQKTIISRINFIQTFPANYSTKLSRFFLCLLDTMCLVHPRFLNVHLQTSHSISI